MVLQEDIIIAQEYLLHLHKPIQTKEPPHNLKGGGGGLLLTKAKKIYVLVSVYKPFLLCCILCSI